MDIQSKLIYLGVFLNHTRVIVNKMLGNYYEASGTSIES